MDKYIVKLYSRAYRDLDGIYAYIADNLLEPDTALKMIDDLGSYPKSITVKKVVDKTRQLPAPPELTLRICQKISIFQCPQWFISLWNCQTPGHGVCLILFIYP